MSQYFPPDMGGASTRVSNAIQSLRDRGHEVFVVTAFPHYPHGNIPREYRRRAFAVEGDSKVKVFRVWVPPLPHEGAKRLVMYVSFTLFSLLSLPFSGKVDVVWALSPNYFSAVSGFFYKMFKRVPMALDVVDLWPEALVNLGFVRSNLLVKMINFTVRVSYKLSDRIITLNMGMKRAILLYEKNGYRVLIVPNTVDLKVFQPFKKGLIPSLSSKFVVMYSGNLGPMYDFDVVLNSARSLSSFADIIFVLRGSGELAESVRKKISELELENVLLFDGVLDIKSVVQFLGMADVLLLPMKKLENSDISYPIKLTEYFACGKPVVCCAEGETARLVAMSEAGVVVPPGNTAELSSAVLNLYNNPRIAKEFGLKGRAFVSKNYSCEAVGAKLEEALFIC